MKTFIEKFIEVANDKISKIENSAIKDYIITGDSMKEYELKFLGCR